MCTVAAPEHLVHRNKFNINNTNGYAALYIIALILLLNTAK